MSLQTHEERTEVGEQRKVVVKYSDGRMVRAYLTGHQDQVPPTEQIDAQRLKDLEGMPLDFAPHEIKAIFVVKSFEGNPNYVEFKNFPERPGDAGLWVRVLFKDKESLEGVAPNSLATFTDPIFYMTPPDPQSNNQAVLVSKASLADMQVLGFEATQ